MMLEAKLERTRQSIKIDISTDDAITSSAVEYEYKLMFQSRCLSTIQRLFLQKNFRQSWPEVLIIPDFEITMMYMNL